ncbi:MFS transporter [Dyella sp. 20L07]|uniref:MFS transporter n=1 Tax=Dyella sp. 20L07 TaxID=3384240 RepID=UPI003D2A7C76
MTSDGLLSRRYRALTIGMVALTALGAFESLAVATAMPAVAKALDGMSLYALSFASTLAASVVGMVVAGQWSDARGPVKPLWIGVVLFVAGLLMGGFAPDMVWLLWGRIVQGFGAGAIAVVLYVIVARMYPADLQPRVFAAFSAGWVIPSLFGPTISGLIVEHIGWRWVFLAVPMVAVPAALMMRPGLRELAPERVMDKRRSPLLDRRIGWSICAATGACVLHLAVEWPGVKGAALFVAALLSLVISVRHLMPIGTLLALPGLPSVIALRGMTSAAFFGMEAFLPLLLSREFGVSPVWAGAVLMIGALGWSASSWYQGNTRKPWTRTQLLQVGMMLMVLGVLVLAVATAALMHRSTTWTSPTMIAGAILGWAITGAGMGLVSPTLSVLTLAWSAPAEQGRNSSALRLADAFGVAGVLAIHGSLFTLLLRQPTGAYLMIFVISGALAMLGFGLSARTRLP